MTKRQHLTPPIGVPAVGGVHAMRRGGARRDISERVYLKGDNGEAHEGWALNVSRGGVRAICEERITLGADFDVTVGEEAGLTRRGRIVWVQEEPDGVIIGIEFVGASQTFRSAPPPPPGAEVHDPNASASVAGTGAQAGEKTDAKTGAMTGATDAKETLADGKK